jgi:type I restriction enzyme S subunit
MKTNWETVPAAEFCSSVRDGTHASPKEVATGELLITSRHIIGGRVDLSNAYRISREDFEETNRRSKVDQWDVLISMIGTVGEACLIRDEPNFAIKNIGLFKNKSELEGKWLYYYLRSPEAQQLIRSNSRGSTQQYIPLGALRELPVSFPKDRGEMGAIVETLSSIDDKLEQNRRTGPALEGLARATFKAWFVDFEPVKAKAAGQTSFPGMPPAAFAALPNRLTESPLGPVPEGWGIGTLEDVAKIEGGRQLERIDYSESGKYEVFGANGVMGRTTRSTHEGFVIVFGRVGAYCGSLHWSLSGAWVNNNASALVPTRDAEWVLQLLLQVDFTPFRKGSAQPFIPNSALAELPVLLPERTIVESFCDVTGPFRQMQATLAAESAKLAALRDYLLPRLLSGRVRVSNVELPTREAM